MCQCYFHESKVSFWLTENSFLVFFNFLTEIASYFTTAQIRRARFIRKHSEKLADETITFTFFRAIKCCNLKTFPLCTNRFNGPYWNKTKRHISEIFLIFYMKFLHFRYSMFEFHNALDLIGIGFQFSMPQFQSEM